MIQWKNGYFYDENGSRYIPMGMFGCYFRTEYVGEELMAASQHGTALMEFQHATRSIWQRLFRFLSEEDGCTAIRMFPRGDCGGSAWEGLDIGGRVHQDLFDKIKAYLADARPYGIKLHLCLFTEPECSFYCQKDTRTYWGRRLWSKEEIANAAPSQRRFLENTDDIVTYSEFFSDPDVRDCCHRYLDEIIPQLLEFEDLFCVELFNESGWASPHADPANTFRWEDTPAYLDWHKDMIEHIHRIAPDLPVCISNPGISILGHDTIHWSRETKPDFFSFHNYPEICGARPGVDYAAVCDMAVQYTAAECPTMMGEWQGNHIRPPYDAKTEHLLKLLSRDVTWLTLLSGTAGAISWCARGYGQYHAVKDIFAQLDSYSLTPNPALIIDISEAQKWFESLWLAGEETCAYPAHKWCPDRRATDGKHRFCLKGESEYYNKLLLAEKWSLETGVSIRFSQTEGKPLSNLTKEDFTSCKSMLDPIVGYQQKVFSADEDRVRLVYLRNYVSAPYMTRDAEGNSVESFSLRDCSPVPVTLSGMDTSYRVRLYDLDTRCWTEIDPAVSTGLGVTDHDYIVLMEK